MNTRNASAWIVTLLITAGWALAPGGAVARAQADGVSRATGQTAGGAGRDDRAFDSSITVPELFEKAREAFGLNRPALAEQYYQEILIRERANVQAMLELSNVYERSGKLEYARGLLVRSAKLAPGNPDIAERLSAVEHMLTIVLSAEVDSLLAAGQYELALPKLSVHLSIEPENAELLYKRALCYSHLGRPDAAISSIDRALQIDPREKYYQLRSSLLEDIKHEETKEKVARARALIGSEDPGARSRALDVLGEILQDEPDHAWARAEFVRLSKARSAPVDTSDAGGLAGLAGRAASAVSATGRHAVSIVGRHLSAILLLFAVVVVFRSPITRLITRRLAPRAFLTGRFPRFTLTEILVMLNSEAHTGVLHVKGEGCRGKVYIEGGEPCHCVVGKLQGVNALHHLLVSTSNGSFEFCDGSIPLNRTIDTPLSVILVDHKSGGPGRAAQRRARATAREKKPKSRMKELLESKSRE